MQRPAFEFFTLMFMQEVTGIYVNNFDSALNTKNGFPVFATVVEANFVTKKQDLFSALRLTDEDKSDIEKLSKDPRIGQRVIDSDCVNIVILSRNKGCWQYHHL